MPDSATHVVAAGAEAPMRARRGHIARVLWVVLVSMALFLTHAIAISDTVTIVSVSLALVRTLLIAGMLISRRKRSAERRAVARRVQQIKHPHRGRKVANGMTNIAKTTVSPRGVQGTRGSAAGEWVPDA